MLFVATRILKIFVERQNHHQSFDFSSKLCDKNAEIPSILQYTSREKIVEEKHIFTEIYISRKLKLVSS